MFFKLQETRLETIFIAGEEAKQFQGEKWKLSLAEMVSYLNSKSIRSIACHSNKTLPVLDIPPVRRTVITAFAHRVNVPSITETS